ncbi:MAG: DinB family protein [Anaerolineales bacterium]
MKVTKIIQFWKQVRKGLIDTIEKFSGEDLNYIAYKNGYSVRQIILHIAQEEYGEIQYGITREIDEFPPLYVEHSYPTIESIKALLAGVHKETIGYLESLVDEDLEIEIEAQWGETYPLIDMIWHVMEHEIHHRGELSLILGLLGREGLDA